MNDVINQINQKAINEEQLKHKLKIDNMHYLEQFIKDSLKNIDELAIILAIKGLENVSKEKIPIILCITNHDLIHNALKKIFDALSLDYIIKESQNMSNKYTFMLNSSNIKDSKHNDETIRLNNLMDKVYAIYTAYPFIFYESQYLDYDFYENNFLNKFLTAKYNYPDIRYIDNIIVTYDTTSSIVNNFEYMFKSDYKESEKKIDHVSHEMAKFIYSHSNKNYGISIYDDGEQNLINASILYASFVMLGIYFKVYSYVTHSCSYFEQDGYTSNDNELYENYFEIVGSKSVNYSKSEIEMAKKVLSSIGANTENFKSSVKLVLNKLNATNGYNGEIIKSFFNEVSMPQFSPILNTKVPIYKVLKKNRADARNKHKCRKIITTDKAEIIEVTLEGCYSSKNAFSPQEDTKSYSAQSNSKKTINSMVKTGIFLTLIIVIFLTI